MQLKPEAMRIVDTDLCRDSLKSPPTEEDLATQDARTLVLAKNG